LETRPLHTAINEERKSEENSPNVRRGVNLNNPDAPKKPKSKSAKTE